MKKNLDSYFKDKLNRGHAPPPDAWSTIASKLPQKSKRRVFPIIWKSAAVVALLIGMWGTGYWFGHKNAQNEGETAISNAASTNTETPVSISSTASETDGLHSVSTVSTTAAETAAGYDTDTRSDGRLYAQHSVNQGNYFDSQTGIQHADYSLHQPISPAALQFYGPGWGIAENDTHSASFFPETDLNLSLNSKENSLSDASFALNIPETDLFEKNLKNNSKKNKKNLDFDRFHIGGFMSPMSLNSFVGSSMLSDEMSSYKTENSIILAYGFKGGYSLSPSVKLRTGVSVVGFEQITKNVPVASTAKNMSSGHSAIENVHYKGLLRIGDADKDPSTGMDGNTSTGDIRQQSQYYEIPLEAEVLLVETGSIGISATGGASTWLLSKNKIYVHTDGFTEELGRANNLNTTTFSANLGLKFDMKLTEDIQLNLEPGFKYLINPVNNIEKFNPYTIGVNAGVSVSLK